MEEFIFKKDILIKDRPVGVSGLMRVKNEEKFLALSIESCIDALDELIIVYQKSKDKTAEIIEHKRKEYPEKIKVYFYKPEIKSHKLSDEEFEELKKLPSDSIHLLSNYYNYTLSKATYKYALKIDADQIYNTVKLKEICDLYRTTQKVNINFFEKITGFLFNFIFIFSFKLAQKTRIKPYNLLPSSLFKQYHNYCLKKIQNEKITSSLSGLNLFFKNEEPVLLNGNTEDHSFPPFNGIYDHMIFPINQYTFYVPEPGKSNQIKYGNCIIESFHWDTHVLKIRDLKTHIVHLGFFWYHLAAFNLCDIKYDNSIKFHPTKWNRINYKKIKDSLYIRFFNRSRIWLWFYYKNWDKQTQKQLESWQQMIYEIKNIVSIS